MLLMCGLIYKNRCSIRLRFIHHRIRHQISYFKSKTVFTLDSCTAGRAYNCFVGLNSGIFHFGHVYLVPVHPVFAEERRYLIHEDQVNLNIRNIIVKWQEPCTVRIVKIEGQSS